jgi:hypothetical protein
MGKFIKGKDGKFAGSIGDGKNKVPTAGSVPPLVASTDAAIESMDRVQELMERYIAQENEKIDVPTWAAQTIDTLSELNATLDASNETLANMHTKSPGQVEPVSGSRIVRFIPQPQLGQIRVEFIHNGVVLESKYLTANEEEGLDGVINVNENQDFDAAELQDIIDNESYFDTVDGDETNFEKMLRDLLRA